MARSWQFNDYAIDALTLVEQDLPPLGESDVRVAVRALSLNYRDLLVLEGWVSRDLALPVVPLSDFSGEVIEVGAGVEEFSTGDGVVSNYVADWQDGPFQDRYLKTTLGTPGPGVAATELVLPETALVAKPASLTHAEGATLPIAALTAWSGLHAGDPLGPGSSVLALGTGGVSVVGLQMAKAMGARVIAIDVMDERLRLATDLGADHTINAAASDPVQAILDLTGGQGATASLETSGNPTARQQTLKCLRPFARACYVGVGGPAEIDFNRDVIFKVLTVFGSWTFSKAELIEIARFFVDTKAPLDRLITHRYGLDEAIEAFQTFDGATTGKCVFVFD